MLHRTCNDILSKFEVKKKNPTVPVTDWIGSVTPAILPRKTVGLYYPAAPGLLIIGGMTVAERSGLKQ